MSGLFGTLNTATSGLRAQQTALQTTSHNLANANTEGYSRQRVTLEANVPISYAGIGQVGTGVLLNGVTRVTDDFVTMQLQNEKASLARYQQQSDIIGQLEGIFNEPSNTGIGHQLSEVFVSWGNLAASPESITSKSMVLRQSETFLDTVNHSVNKAEALEEETVELIRKEVIDFNDLSKQLKSVNDQIFNARVKGELPNDLMDKQDMIIGEMKTIAGVSVRTDDKYGRKFISIGNEEIVSENVYKEIEMAPKSEFDGAGNITTKAGSLKIKDGADLIATTGSIKGLQEAREVVIQKKDELKTFVDNLATAINQIHTNDSETDVDVLIKNNDGSYSINPELLKDPSKLVTGKDVDNSLAGDGSRAKAIADLQSATLSKDPDDWVFDVDSMTLASDASGATFFNRYNDIVTDMGIVKQQSDNMVANQTDLTALLEQRHASISGVDLNEEVVNMIQFQSAFQANSKVISTIAEMLDTIINRMGV